MSSLIPHDYRYKISSPTPVDKEPIFIDFIQKYKKRRRCLLFLFIIQVYDFYAQRFLQLRSERIL